MNREKKLFSKFEKEISETREKFNDFRLSVNSKYLNFLSAAGVQKLLLLNGYFFAGILTEDDYELIDRFIFPLYNLILERKFGDKEIAEKQLELAWRAITPTMYSLDKSDIDKGFKALDKKTAAVKAQAIRIRRMMISLAFAVEPIQGESSVLEADVQLNDGRYRGSDEDVRHFKGLFKDVSYSLLNESFFVGLDQYSIAQRAYKKLKKDSVLLEDLAITALQIFDPSFKRKKTKYLRSKLREFEEWEKKNVPAWALKGKSGETKHSDKNLPFGVTPILQRVFNLKKVETLALYYFDEEWKNRREGSGGSRKSIKKL